MKKTVIGLTLLVAVSAVFFFVNSYVYEVRQEATDVPEPYRTTLTGQHVCLPPLDPSVPNTDDCAAGIRTVEGTYYALDFALMSQTLPALENGQQFSASGVVTAIERLSTDYWQRFDVQGIFSVTDSVQLIGEMPSVPEPEVIIPSLPATPSEEQNTAAECYVGGCSSQLCTDQPDMASDCMYREEYACYQTATCERQSTGQCGWTETNELRACIANSTGSLE